MTIKIIFLIAMLGCASFTLAQAQTNTSTVHQSAQKVKYLYQSNAGFAVYFENGTYARKFGEYTEAELKNGFKNLKPEGKWRENKKGIVEDSGEKINFQDEDGELNYKWQIFNYKEVTN